MGLLRLGGGMPAQEPQARGFGWGCQGGGGCNRRAHSSGTYQRTARRPLAPVAGTRMPVLVRHISNLAGGTTAHHPEHTRTPPAPSSYPPPVHVVPQ